MPVVAKQKTAMEQIYDYRIPQTGWTTVFDTVASGIQQRLHIFSSHHQKCAVRRKNALSYELRLEKQRTEWLKNKYLDSSTRHGQQQVLSVRVDSSAGTSSASARGLELMDRRQQHINQQQLAGDFSVSRINNSSKSSADSPPRSTLDGETCTKASSNSADPNILIKREPDTDNCQLSPSKACTELPPFTTKNESQNHIELKRRLSQTIKSDKPQWSSLSDGTEATQDELKLTAYDVIAGVISTHPIQPLEQDTENASTNGHKVAASSSSPPSSTSTLTTSNEVKATSHAPRVFATTLPSTLTKNKTDQLALVQDLDDFSKVMHQVTQEQIAKERRNSLPDPVEPPPVYPGPRHLDPPPYLAMRQPRPLDLPLQTNAYYQQQKYALPPSQSQVNSTYHSKSIKPQLILPTGPCVLSDSSNVPATPTTPLEHFSAFHSPPHLPLRPIQSPVTQTCPPPHLSMGAPQSPVPQPPPYSNCYPYSADTMHHQTSSSVNAEDEWPLHVSRSTQHSVLPDTPTRSAQEHNSILSHVTSAATLAGQKRPIQELNGSVAFPPTKLHGPLHAITSASCPLVQHGRGYPASLPLPTYHASSAPLTFPHQPL